MCCHMENRKYWLTWRSRELSPQCGGRMPGGLHEGAGWCVIEVAGVSVRVEFPALGPTDQAKNPKWSLLCCSMSPSQN